jgi:hypothetical protein
MTQTIEYVVKVDANQAKTTIADVEKRFESVATPTSKFGAGLGDITKQAKDMAGKMAPAAAAISSVSAAMGAAGGEAGKLVAGAGQVAAAFGAGGPWAAALVVATSAVDAFSKHLLEVESAREAAFDKSFEKQNENILSIHKRVQALNEELRNLATELRNVGKTSDEIAIRDAQEEAKAKRAEARRLANIAISPKDIDAKERINAQRQSDALELEAKRLDEIAIKRIQIRQLQEHQDNEKRAKAQAEADAKRRESEEKAWERRWADIVTRNDQEVEEAQTTTDEITRIMRGRTQVEGPWFLGRSAQRQAALDALTDEDILTGGKGPMRFDIAVDEKTQKEMMGKVYASGAERQIEIEGNKLDIIGQLNDEFRQRDAQAWKGFYDGFANMGMEAMSMLAGATQDYIQMKIEGEKNAELLAGAALMQTAGQALVGHGINLAGQAVVSAFTPGLQPLAAAQGVASAALIGAGIGLGAGGASLSHIAAGGTVGKPLEDKKAAKDRGASPRGGSGGGGSSGGLVVNVSYGAGGPLPEDIAREIDKVVKSNDRRRGAA